MENSRNSVRSTSPNVSPVVSPTLPRDAPLAEPVGVGNSLYFSGLSNKSSNASLYGNSNQNRESFQLDNINDSTYICSKEGGSARAPG
jgi:hypothetical protein